MMRKFISALVLFSVAGCGGGGSSPLSCDFNIFFNGDVTLKDMVEQIKLQGSIIPYHHRFHSGVTGSQTIIDDQNDGTTLDRINLFGSLNHPESADIVVVNSGRWDLGTNTPPNNHKNLYRQNITDILSWYQDWFVAEGKPSNVIFMLTLRYRDDNRNNLVDEYNDIANEVCDSLGVTVFDPNDLSDVLQYEDNFHLDTVSNVLLAEYFNTFLGVEFECIPF